MRQMRDLSTHPKKRPTQRSQKKPKPRTSGVLFQNASDVRFFDMHGPSRRRSFSAAGMVEHGENRADGVF